MSCVSRLRLFDTDGIDAFIEVIRAEMNEIFPDYDSTDYVLTEEEEAEELAGKDDDDDDDDGDGDGEERIANNSKTKTKTKTKTKEPFFATLQKRISRGSDSMLYFEDFTQEINYDPAQGPRYDVLAIFMVEFNSFISSRLVPVRSFKRMKIYIHNTYMHARSRI